MGNSLFYLKNPLSVYKSIFYSLKHNGSLKGIKAHKNTSIIKSKQASMLELDSVNIGLNNTELGSLGMNSDWKTVLQVGPNASLTIGKNSFIYSGVKILVEKGAFVSIGAGSLVSLYSNIFAKERIEIGDGCFVSWGVQIIDSDHHTVVIDGHDTVPTKPISIGDRVWVGCNATILKGVTIGNNCIVAAGAVVTKSFPDNVLIGGNPARVIKENIDWKE